MDPLARAMWDAFDQPLSDRKDEEKDDGNEQAVGKPPLPL